MLKKIFLVTSVLYSFGLCFAEAASIVLSRSTPIYREASKSSEMLGRYPSGTRFKAEESEDGWYQITLSRPYKGADVVWIAKEDVDGGGAERPSAAAPRSRSYNPKSPKNQKTQKNGGGKFELAPGLAYGLNSWYKLGLGLRFGYRITPQFSLSVRGEYFLGTSIETAGTGTTEGYGGIQTDGSSSTTLNSWTLLGEAGYDFSISNNGVLRPLLGVGIVGLATAASTSVGSVSGTGTATAIVPGVSWMVKQKSSFYGVDLRYTIISNSSTSDSSTTEADAEGDTTAADTSTSEGASALIFTLVYGFYL